MNDVLKNADGSTALNVYDQPIRLTREERDAARRPRSLKPLASLPKIVRFIDSHWGDPGEMECPHCGARGTVVHTFELEDGRHAGAMSGCIKLFPVSPVASEDLKLRKKEADHKRGKGYGLNRWDQMIRAAIDAFYAGTKDERETILTIQFERAKATNWRRARYGGR